MTRQVLKMAYNGTWTVKFDIEKNVNPYTVMYSWNELTAHGLQTHRKKIAEYADFYSCLCFLKDHVEPGDIHKAR